MQQLCDLTRSSFILLGHDALDTPLPRPHMTMPRRQCISHIFTLTLDKQDSWPVAMRNFRTISLDHASYDINSGHLKQTIETLEQGRG
jgi:hypothetical protein